jgi:predicted DNA-binding protein YlxM (UPF0122 family)
MITTKQKNRKETNTAVEFAIEQHLAILNSEIIMPTKKGKVNEIKLLATVKAREKIFNNVISLLDNEDLSDTIKGKSKKSTLDGLKKTRSELLEKVVKRPMRVELTRPEDEETSDDIISAVSDAVKTATDIVFLIERRIELYEDPELLQKEMIEYTGSNVAEQYAEN